MRISARASSAPAANVAARLGDVLLDVKDLMQKVTKNRLVLKQSLDNKIALRFYSPP